MRREFKGIVYPKMKIESSFTHPGGVLMPYGLLALVHIMALNSDQH